MNQENEIKQVSLKKAHANGTFTAIRTVVRSNEKGYKFVTVLNGKAATNVYLGKKSSNMVMEGEDITDKLATANLVKATNEAGEARLKLSFNGDSEYVSAENLFGTSSEIADSEKEVLNFLAEEYSTVTVDEAITEKVN